MWGGAGKMERDLRGLRAALQVAKGNTGVPSESSGSMVAQESRAPRLGSREMLHSASGEPGQEELGWLSGAWTISKCRWGRPGRDAVYMVTVGKASVDQNPRHCPCARAAKWW